MQSYVRDKEKSLQQMQSKLSEEVSMCITKKKKKTTPEINSDSLLWNVGFLLFCFCFCISCAP